MQKAFFAAADDSAFLVTFADQSAVKLISRRGTVSPPSAQVHKIYAGEDYLVVETVEYGQRSNYYPWRHHRCIFSLYSLLPAAYGRLLARFPSSYADAAARANGAALGERYLGAPGLLAEW